MKVYWEIGLSDAFAPLPIFGCLTQIQTHGLHCVRGAIEPHRFTNLSATWQGIGPFPSILSFTRTEFTAATPPGELFGSLYIEFG